jgi:3-hydroxyacyl-CoA dehydrogenase
VLKKLLELGNLGQKSKAGFYKKVGRDITRFDLGQRGIRPGRCQGRRGLWPHAEEACRRAPASCCATAEGPQGQFLWAILRNGFHYAAVHLATMCRQRARC